MSKCKPNDKTYASDTFFFIFSLIRLLHKYARENLLLANIYIKDPAVTMIRRDQKIPVIWFVANIGGILGLCMGCSLVTVFEVLHHIVLIFLKTSVKSVSRIHRTIRCVPESTNQVSSGVTLAAMMQLGSNISTFTNIQPQESQPSQLSADGNIMQLQNNASDGTAPLTPNR